MGQRRQAKDSIVIAAFSSPPSSAWKSRCAVTTNPSPSGSNAAVANANRLRKVIALGTANKLRAFVKDVSMIPNDVMLIWDQGGIDVLETSKGAAAGASTVANTFTFGFFFEEHERQAWANTYLADSDTQVLSQFFAALARESAILAASMGTTSIATSGSKYAKVAMVGVWGFRGYEALDISAAAIAAYKLALKKDYELAILTGALAIFSAWGLGLIDDGGGKLIQAPPRGRALRFLRQPAGQREDGELGFGGKRSSADPNAVHLASRRAVARRTVAARCRPCRSKCPSPPRSRDCSADPDRPPVTRFSRDTPRFAASNARGPALRVPGVPDRTEQSSGHAGVALGSSMQQESSSSTPPFCPKSTFLTRAPKASSDLVK